MKWIGAVTRVQREQWDAWPARFEQNYAEMRRAGVAVSTKIDDVLRESLNQALILRYSLVNADSVALAARCIFNVA